MSTISTWHDGLVTEMTTLFPDKKVLTDPQVVTNNDLLQLRDAWGIYYGIGINTKRLVGCKLSIRREISITLSNSIEGHHKENTKRRLNEKQIFEDQLLLIKLIETNDDLHNIVAKAEYLGDNGLQRVFADKKEYVMLRSNFSIEYFEQF